MKGSIAIALLALLQAAQTTTTTTTTGGQTTWSGIYSETQAKRGEALYGEKCASCHGPDLAGADQAPPLTGGDFSTNWNDLSVNDLFERIRISMPADNPGTLSRQQVADVVAFLLNKGNVPPGQIDLPTEAAVLKEIKFLSTRP